MSDFELTSEFPRPLTELESAILNRIFELDFEGADEYRSQVNFSTVVSKCQCGCPTINIEVDHAAPRAVRDEGYGPLKVEGLVSAEGDQPVAGILVFSRNGYLTSLEYLDVQATGEANWPELNRVSAIKN